jgi:hypothetical protein
MDMHLAQVQAETVAAALQAQWPEKRDQIEQKLAALVADLETMRFIWEAEPSPDIARHMREKGIEFIVVNPGANRGRRLAGRTAKEYRQFVSWGVRTQLRSVSSGVSSIVPVRLYSFSSFRGNSYPRDCGRYTLCSGVADTQGCQLTTLCVLTIISTIRWSIVMPRKRHSKPEVENALRYAE